MMIENEELGRNYDYKHPSRGFFRGSTASLVRELAATPAFVRLSDIRFLGAIDYALIKQPNGYSTNRRYTRHEHSLGVAALADYFCDLADLPARSRNLIVAAALLHDLGHSPLSHSVEPVFKRLFGLDHHLMTERLIRGEAALSFEIPAILSRHGIDAGEVLAVLDGRRLGEGGFFAGPINFDTIEGISRSLAYARPRRHSSHPRSVVRSSALRLSTRDRMVVDDFWMNKDNAYLSIINSNMGAVADEAARLVLIEREDALSEADFLLGEAGLFGKFPLLRKVVSSGQACAAFVAERRPQIQVTRRRFFIDEGVDFASRDDRRRYLQSKRAATLTVQSIIDEPSHNASLAWTEIAQGDC